MRELTVSELVDIINGKFLEIEDFWVLGEVSNLKIYPSGHIYFTLKDEHNQINCVLFYSRLSIVKVKPENFKKYRIYGHLEFYGKGGNTNIIVEDVYPAGFGELAMKFEMLKEKLSKEGLFSLEHKKKIPKFPERIGIVTSLEGEAIKDMIRTIRGRFPPVRIFVRPSLVQGEKAAEDIAQGIRDFNEFGNVDVIIIGRGGGSLEDLWAFNEEVVARAIYDSKIPVISAVGHAEDFTISDFVADVRAITPTDAGNIVVPSSIEIIGQLNNFERIMVNSLRRKKLYLEEKLLMLSRSKVFRYPFSIIEERYFEIDRFYGIMKRAILTKLSIAMHKISGIKFLKPRIEEKKNHIYFLEKNLKREMFKIFTVKSEFFKSLENRLYSTSPEKTLRKGYSIVFKDGHVVKSVNDLFKDDVVRLKMIDGEKNAEII
uniref:Exodeoxyribonuclease 7 large subunit n=1 Tax=candidate division WOR-3 bacterium TaxID=2052148 RepID=A0A7C4YGK2_UNCW3